MAHLSDHETQTLIRMLNHVVDSIVELDEPADHATPEGISQLDDVIALYRRFGTSPSNLSDLLELRHEAKKRIGGSVATTPT